MLWCISARFFLLATLEFSLPDSGVWPQWRPFQVMKVETLKKWLNKVQEETLFLLLLPFQVEIISEQSGDNSQEHPIGSP